MEYIETIVGENVLTKVFYSDDKISMIIKIILNLYSIE